MVSRRNRAQRRFALNILTVRKGKHCAPGGSGRELSHWRQWSFRTFVLQQRISHNLRLTAYRADATSTSILAPEGCLLEHLLEDGARSGVPRRAAGNRSSREAPDPALRALGPGCEELAVTDPPFAESESSRQVPVEGSAAPGPKSQRWSAE